MHNRVNLLLKLTRRLLAEQLSHAWDVIKGGHIVVFIRGLEQGVKRLFCNRRKENYKQKCSARGITYGRVESRIMSGLNPPLSTSVLCCDPLVKVKMFSRKNYGARYLLWRDLHTFSTINIYYKQINMISTAVEIIFTTVENTSSTALENDVKQKAPMAKRNQISTD